MTVRLLATLLVVSSLCSVSFGQKVTVQSEDDVLPDGSAFLWIEAESAVELGGGAPEDATTGFILVDSQNPKKTITETNDGSEVINGGRDVLPEDTNASGGGAIFHDIVGGGNAKWNLQFAIPADYYLYTHYSFYNRDNNTNYGNEDSIYVAPGFNLNSRDDWIGFEGVDAEGEPKTGDSNRDGWMPLPKDVVSEGGVETHNSTDEEYWEGFFAWAHLDVAVDMDENNAFVSDVGHGIRYDVKEEDVGTVLSYEISTREQYGVIDGMLFSTSDTLLDDFSQDQLDEFFLNMEGTLVGDFDQSGLLDLPDVNMLSEEIAGKGNDPAFDVTGDGMVDEADLTLWVKGLRGTWFGDSNLDDEFNSGDLVLVFARGEYEDDIVGNSTWDDGDWNADLEFNSSDLVAAFTDGGYEQGPAARGNAVPEPSAAILCLLGVAMLARRRRRVGA